jgi:ATP-dependent Zn protease
MDSTAHHEAGHAVLQILLDLGCTGVSLATHGGGLAGVTGFDEWGVTDKDDCEATARGQCAGRTSRQRATYHFAE